MFNLDRGAIERMTKHNDKSIRPILQVIDVKKIVTGSAGERYRLILSDGQHYTQGMLSSQATKCVKSGQFSKFSVIQVNEWVTNDVQGRRICVVIECNVIGNAGKGIGAPVNISPKSSSSSNMSNNRPPAPPTNQQSFNQRQQFNKSNNGNNGNNRYGGSQYSRNGGGGGGFNKPNRGNQGNQGNFQPVSSLNPYNNNWRIKVRVTKKDSMRHWSNAKGEGKLFSLDLLDKQGTEIRATCFNASADKFYSIFEQNKIYIISRGSVRLARNKGYTHITNDYSITLNEDAEVIPVEDEDNEIEQQRYKFINIESIENCAAKTFVDVIGIVTDVGPISNIVSQSTQRELARRTIKIMDKTASIDVTLWNDDAKNYSDDKVSGNRVMALKACKVSTFGGRSLSASGKIELDPDRKEGNDLLLWFKNGGSTNSMNFKQLTSGSGGSGGGDLNSSERKIIKEIKEMKLNENEKGADWFTVVGTITHISHSQDRKPWYEANPDPNSTAKNAKVIDMGNGKWRCEKNGQSYDSYVPRYILRFCVTDWSGNMWLTAFNEAAEKVLGCTASEAEKLSNDNPQQYEEIFTNATFKKYVFRCNAKKDNYQDEERVRYTAQNAKCADYINETEKLFEKMNKLNLLK